ncbi:MAG TPA: hypothetical protein VFJ58_02790 [Armatimonadota bacterium]|nr:hypothetical protein [Armatimonadota bacterium]
MHTETSADGDGVELKREARLRKPFRPSKRIEEWTVGQLFAAGYNAVHGTNLRLAAPRDDRDADLVLVYERPQVVKRDSSILICERVQIVKCADSRIWKALARDGIYTDDLSESQVVDEILEGIAGKKKHRYSNAAQLILLLDGGMTAVLRQTLERMSSRNSGTLNEAGFKEIWYASRATGEAFRLYPSIATETRYI